VASDVYKAVGGTERMRVFTMNVFRYSFVVALTLMVAGSLVRDRETYRRGVLRRSWTRFRRSPIAQPAVWAQLKDYNRADFHPDDSDTDELLDRWRRELFGETGTLNDRLAGATHGSARRRA
jgi:predicted metal-dependent hydrolase